MRKLFIPSKASLRLVAGGVVLAALSACGGGGVNTANTDGTTSPTISGKVIDGYIRGATVFWDCNNNNQFDNGEISTITTAGGNYIIADKSSVGCELLALVGADAIDESRPYTSGQSYTMKAAPGRSDLITPFSTLIAGRVSSTGVTAAKAEADIASLLGVNGSLLVDYKATNVDPNAVILATSAAVIANSLHKNQKNAIFTDGVTQTYDEIKTRFVQTGFLDSINRGLVPFVNTYKSIFDILSKIVLGNANNRLYRKVNFNDAAANNFLDAMALEVNSRGAVKYGAVNWGAFTNDELKKYLKEIHRINALSSDSLAQSNIQALQARRQKLFVDAGLRLNKVVGSDGDLVGVYGFFTNDPGATLDFALEMISISIDSAIDVTTIAGTRPPIGRPNDYAKKHKSLNKMLDNFAFMTSAVKCAKASSSIDDSEVGMTTKITSLVGDCGSFFADVAADATTIARSRDVTKAASGAMSAVGGFGGAIDPKQRALIALKMYSTALGLVHDVVEPFVKDPITTRFLAAADLGIQYLNASSAGLELEIAATEKLDQGAAAAMAMYEREVETAWRSYFISSMQITADFHFEIADSTLVKPVVTSLLSGFYDFGNDGNGGTCYYKNSGTLIVPPSEYAMSQAKYCLNAARTAWVASSSNSGEVFTPSGWTSKSVSTVLFNTDSAGVLKYAGTEFQNIGITPATVSATFPAGAKAFTIGVTNINDQYTVPNNSSTPNYLYTHAPTIASMMSQFNTSQNGQSTLSRTNGFGWAFDTPSSAAALSGVVRYYDIAVAPICTNTGCSRAVAASATWIRTPFTDGTDSIELRTPVGFSDMNLSGNTGQKVVYFKRPLDAGVVEGYRELSGATRNFPVYNRIHFDTQMLNLNLPKTVN